MTISHEECKIILRKWDDSFLIEWCEMMNYRENVEKFDKLFVSLGEWILHNLTSETLGLSLKEMMVLEITGMRKTIIMSELSSVLHLPPTTTTSIVDRMVRKGYLKRERLEEERRLVVISLSHEGQILWEQHRKEHMDCALELFSVISNEEQELLINVLEKIVNYLAEKYKSQ